MFVSTFKNHWQIVLIRNVFKFMPSNISNQAESFTCHHSSREAAFQYMSSYIVGRPNFFNWNFFFTGKVKRGTNFPANCP